VSGWSNTVSRGVRVAEGALWGGAGLLALTAHVGAAAWLLREPPLVPSDNMPPVAIMIEFAEMPEAMMTEENEISPDQKTTATIVPDEKLETPDVTPEEMAEPDPADDVSQDEPEIIENEDLSQLDDVEVPLPEARPHPPEKKPEKKKPVRPPRQDQAASKQAVQAQVQTKQSNRDAGRQTASGLFSSLTPAKWQSRLMAHLERRKRYPSGSRSRGERGIVYVRFSIDQSGNVLSVTLAKSSGFSELDQEVLSLVRRASPVPAPPPGASTTITAPVRFNVR